MKFIRNLFHPHKIHTTILSSLRLSPLLLYNYSIDPINYSPLNSFFPLSASLWISLTKLNILWTLLCTSEAQKALSQRHSLSATTCSYSSSLAIVLPFEADANCKCVYFLSSRKRVVREDLFSVCCRMLDEEILGCRDRLIWGDEERDI